MAELNSDKNIDELELVDKIKEVIEQIFPKINRLIVSFHTENEVVTLVNAPCSLCAVDDAKINMLKNGAVHAESPEDSIYSLLESIFGEVVAEDGLKERAQREILMRFDSKVKN